MIIVGVLAVAALLVFYQMNRSVRKRNDEHSERLQRHKEYYDALMERRKKSDPAAVDKKNESEDL